MTISQDLLAHDFLLAPPNSPHHGDGSRSPSMPFELSVPFTLFTNAYLGGAVSPSARKFTVVRTEGGSPSMDPRSLGGSPLTNRSFTSDPASSPFGFRASPVAAMREAGELDDVAKELHLAALHSEVDDRRTRDFIDCLPHLSPYQLIQQPLYKLFIDQKRWMDERGGVYLTRNTFDVREPGYMNAMLRAFQTIMTPEKGSFLTKDFLNSAFIQDLHDEAIENVYSVKYDGLGIQVSSEALRTKYREPGVLEIESFQLKAHIEDIPDVTAGATITPKGALELVSKLTQPIYNYIPENSIDTCNIFMDVLANSKEFRKYADAYKQHIASPGSKAPELPKSIKLRNVPRGFCLSHFVDHFINLFLAAPKDSEEEKLRACALLIQNLDQLHPFNDGNIRVFAILLLNRLLVDLDLSPTCLEDPNCFDCLSIDEIILEIKKGQEHFLSLHTL